MHIVGEHGAIANHGRCMHAGGRAHRWMQQRQNSQYCVLRHGNDHARRHMRDAIGKRRRDQHDAGAAGRCIVGVPHVVEKGKRRRVSRIEPGDARHFNGTIANERATDGCSDRGGGHHRRQTCGCSDVLTEFTDAGATRLSVRQPGPSRAA